jgi:hypothetical protein
MRRGFLFAACNAAHQEETMLTGKGIILGVALFAVGTIIYVYLMIRGSSAQATGTTAIMAWTVMNVFYWLSFVAALIVGCVIIRLLGHRS